MTFRQSQRGPADFDALLNRVLDSGHDDARDNIKRLLSFIRATPDLARIAYSAPAPSPLLSEQQIRQALYMQSLTLPTDPAAELGMILHVLSVIAGAEEVPFFNYTLGMRTGTGAESETREFMRRLVQPSMKYLRDLYAEMVYAREQRHALVRGVNLELEQKVLFGRLVEASRSVPRTKRQKFFLIRTMGGTALSHRGLPGSEVEVYEGDIETLAREGLVAQTYGADGTPQFDVTPKGLQYYEYLGSSDTEPLRGIESRPTTYVGDSEFARQYPAAHGKWRAAEAKLLVADAATQLTEIGHNCREAMQEFGEALVVRANDPNIQRIPKDRTVARLTAVLAATSHLGSTEKPFLKALIAYWGTVADLTQRQEHGGQKEGDSLDWEDARRVVFHTAIVMYETDRALRRGST